MWYAEFTGPSGRACRVSGFRDHTATETLARHCERLVAFKVGREPVSPTLSRWLEGLPPRIRRRLAALDLLTSDKTAALRPLVEHIDGGVGSPGWWQHLVARGNTPAHVRKSCFRVHRVFDGCGFAHWGDIAPGRVMEYLTGLRADRTDGAGNVRRGIAPRTFNHYLGACTAFCDWMLKNRRASTNPLSYLTALNTRVDRRRQRRPLNAEEAAWLLSVTCDQPERFNMSGPVRSLLYKLAIESGLRSAELGSLTPLSFNLNSDSPVVRIAAEHSKHRREDVLPLRPGTAIELQGLIACKMPTVPLFVMRPTINPAEMLRVDLRAAREAWLLTFADDRERARQADTSFLAATDATGRVVDFHALRYTTGSLLAASGVSPKVCQVLMRHADINLTLSLYTATYNGDERRGVAALPDFAPPAGRSAKTGTDDAGQSQSMALSVAHPGAQLCTPIDKYAQTAPRPDEADHPVNTAQSRQPQGDTVAVAGGAQIGSRGSIHPEPITAKPDTASLTESPSDAHGAQCGASLSDLIAGIAAVAPDLAAIVEAWPTLPEAVRTEIVGMVEAVENGPTVKSAEAASGTEVTDQ